MLSSGELAPPVLSQQLPAGKETQGFSPKWAAPGSGGTLSLSYPSLPGKGLGGQALEAGVCVVGGWRRTKSEAKVRPKRFPLSGLAWGF